MSPNAVVGLEASGGGCDRRTGGGITLRVTRLGTPDGEVVLIPNGQVMQVTNLSRDWARAVVDVPLAIGVDVARAIELLRSMGTAAFEDPQLRSLLLDTPTVMGIESFAPGQVNMRRGRLLASSLSR